MLAYERRARWIRRMQDRAARRREREIGPPGRLRRRLSLDASRWLGDGSRRAA